MARAFVFLAGLGAVTVWVDPLGWRWWGAGLAILALAALALRVHRAARRRVARRTLAGLRTLAPAEFEAEVARWLRRDGWDVERRGGTGDGGIDLLATRRGETVAVQCKRYAESAAVGASQVRDLFGAAVAEGATSAVLVTTGRVSAPAIQWAEALPGDVSIAFHDAECVGELAMGRGRVA